MKEVIYEEWQKNPTPRVMWCWNSSEEKKIKAKVIHILSNGICIYPVLSVTDNDNDYETYQHCAEIEKQRRMTNKELSRWLREKPTRECKYSTSISVYSVHAYDEDLENKEVRKDIVIREDDGEWREPLVEVEE